MLPYDKLILFDEYRYLTREQYDYIASRPKFSFKHRVSISKVIDKDDDDNILKLIFAPDPLTGIPRSDLAVIMSKDVSPEVSQYIRDTLLQSVGNDTSAPDSDTALDMMKNRGESLEAYGDRLREIVSSYSKKDDSKSSNDD